MSTAKNKHFSNEHARPDTVTDIIGLDVYTKNGVYIGEVDDIRLDFNQTKSTGVALKDINPELLKVVDNSRDGVVIPYTWVDSIHDIVITINLLERLSFEN